MENSLQPFPSEATPEQTEVDRILGEVARRHRIIVSPGDPMVVVLTMFELVLGRYLQQSDSMLQQQRALMTATVERTMATAKNVAETLITAAADYHVKTTRAAADDASAAVNRAAEEALEKIRLAARNARWLLVFSWGSIAVLIAVALGMFIGIWIAPEVKSAPARCGLTAWTSSSTANFRAARYRAVSGTYPYNLSVHQGVRA